MEVINDLTNGFCINRKIGMTCGWVNSQNLLPPFLFESLILGVYFVLVPKIKDYALYDFHLNQKSVKAVSTFIWLQEWGSGLVQMVEVNPIQLREASFRVLLICLG